jgi:hypothetical protein
LGLGRATTLASYEQGDAEPPLAVLTHISQVYGSAGELNQILLGPDAHRVSASRPQDDRDDPLRDLLDLLRPDRALERLRRLPRQAEEKYDARVKEITARVQRELDEYMKLLESEYGKKAKSST